MEDRQILDIVLVANEVMDDLLHQKEGGGSMQDMEKIYDHVNWDFVDYILERMRFGDKLQE